MNRFIKVIFNNRFRAYLLTFICVIISVFGVNHPAYSQSDLTAPFTAEHDGDHFILPIPDGFCNDINNFFGITIMKQLKKIADQKAAGFINPKLVFRGCNSHQMLPWGYVSLGPKLPQTLTQNDINKQIVLLSGDEDLIKALDQSIGNTINEEFLSDIEISGHKPEVLWIDENVIITLRVVSDKNDAHAVQQATISAATLVDDRVFDYFLFQEHDRFKDEAKLFVQALINNAKKIKSANLNSY